MANLSSYGSDVLFEYFDQNPIDDYPNNEITNDSNIIPYSQYLQETQNAVVQDTNSSAQQDAMIIRNFDVRMEAPSELPKVSMVKTSFQRVKNHLASFDKVVKVRTTPDAITEGSWGFEDTKVVFNQEVIPFIKTLRDLFKDFDNGLLSELNEMKTFFNQMEDAVEQCFVDKKCFDIQKKELFLKNDRLLKHIICQDVMNIVMHADSVSVNVLSANNKCIVYICVNSLATLTNYAKMERDYIDEYSENLVLKADLAKKEQMVKGTTTPVNYITPKKSMKYNGM
ncbi:hypothetical protein Tco_1354839 [Tanacetum coccineum]